MHYILKNILKGEKYDRKTNSDSCGIHFCSDNFARIIDKIAESEGVVESVSAPV